MRESDLPCRVELLHFNDVYHIDPQKTEPVGGAARFVSAVKSRASGFDGADNKPLVLFSGDLFNPSVESSITRGSHMVPVINSVGVDVACYGNHDFDFGVPRLVELAEQCKFPWILSNVFDRNTGLPLANAKQFFIVERCGLRIGIIGLVEEEWLETIPALPSNAQYKDFIRVGRELLDTLYSSQHGCDLVIALTHMRLPNDLKLRDAFPQEELPLILGGHDHFFCIDSMRISETCAREPQMWESDQIRVLKSGCDFREFSHITLWIDKYSRKVHKVRVERVPVDSSWPPDRELDMVLESTRAMISETMDKRVAYSLVPLEARSDVVRCLESNLGNFSADLVRLTYNADVTLLCGGAIRSDAVYEPGPLTVRDIMDIFPFEDPCVVLRLSGQDLLDALENGISAVPTKLEGRFPQISGLRLVYDSKNPPGRRITSCTLEMRPPSSLLRDYSRLESSSFESSESQTLGNGVPIDPVKYYTVATRHYLALGNDGFKSLKNGQYIVDEENGLLLSAIMRRFFLGAKYMNILRRSSKRHFPAEASPDSPNLHSEQSSPSSSPNRIEVSLSQSSSPTVKLAAEKFRKLSRSYVQKCMACPPQTLESPVTSKFADLPTPILNAEESKTTQTLLLASKLSLPAPFSLDKKDRYLPIIAPAIDKRLIDIA